MDHVEEDFTYVSFHWEWELMLFSELTFITHSIDLFRLKGQKSDDDSLQLHSSEPLEVDMADSLVLELDICLNLETFGIHGRFYLV